MIISLRRSLTIAVLAVGVTLATNAGADGMTKGGGGLVAAKASTPAGLVTITPVQVAGFAPKLDAFRNSLAIEERRVLDGILDRAGGRPATDDDDGQGQPSRVAGFERSDLDVAAVNGLVRGALGLQAPVRPKGGNAAIGPKQDDPHRPAPSRAIGPKQDDPGPPPPASLASMNGKLLGFVRSLSIEEKALVGTIFGRASRAGLSSATGPGGGCYPPASNVVAPRNGLLNVALKIGVTVVNGQQAIQRNGIIVHRLNVTASDVSFSPVAPGGSPL